MFPPRLAWRRLLGPSRVPVPRGSMSGSLSPSSPAPPARRRRRFAPAVALAPLLLAPLWFAACSKQSPIALGPNQRPTIELTQAPATTTVPFFYAYELRWAGFDVDGHIDYFRYAIDPSGQANADTE